MGTLAKGFNALARRGNFAVVKLAINKATGERYAIKIIDKKKCFAQSTSRKDAIMGEVEILQGLKHPNVINIKDVFDTDKFLYLGESMHVIIALLLDVFLISAVV